MSKKKSYEKLLEDLVPLDLYNLLRKGLQPYDSHSGKPISCPQTLHQYFEVHYKIGRLGNKIKAFTIPPTDLKEVEKKLSQDGFILVPENASMIARLNDLTDEKVISDEYFRQLRQKDSKYRITLKEIVILWYYRTKLIEKQNKLIKQRSKIVDDDPDLISWRNLVEIKSTKQKKKFSEELEEAFFEQDEVEKVQNEQKSLTDLEKDAKKGVKIKNQIPTPKDTQWHDINIHLVEFEKVVIKFKGQQLKRNYKELGFADGRSTQPTKGWIFLWEMAAANGNPGVQINNLSKKVSDLNKHIRSIFPNVEGKPFKSYASGLGWKPWIKLTIDKKYQQQN